jgi:hypothetical protein
MKGLLSVLPCLCQRCHLFRRCLWVNGENQVFNMMGEQAPAELLGKLMLANETVADQLQRINRRKFDSGPPRFLGQPGPAPSLADATNKLAEAVHILRAAFGSKWQGAFFGVFSAVVMCLARHQCEDRDRACHITVLYSRAPETGKTICLQLALMLMGRPATDLLDAGKLGLIWRCYQRQRNVC